MNRELIVKRTIEIEASAEKVWEALINPELTKQYMYCEVHSDWQVGSPIMWKGLNQEGKEIIFVRGEILALGWRKRYYPGKECPGVQTIINQLVSIIPP